jgi:aldehyde:ferredoxin oxidoreductase
MNIYGWSGRIVKVDLSSGNVKVYPTPEDIRLNFLGGRGGNSKLLYDLTDENTHPFSEENPFIVGTGPLGGTFAPSSGRWTVTSKSPINGMLCDGNSGGHFGPELRFAGYDHLIVTGKAKTPCYISIRDDDIEIRNANHIWGQNVWETDRILREETDIEAQTLVIGPAGENLVKTACVLSNLSRAAGKCGMGAVMGSKNLKGVVVRGTKGVSLYDPDKFLEEALATRDDILTDPMARSLSTYGTPALLMIANEQGWLNTYNSQRGDFEFAENLSAETLLDKYITKSKGCYMCYIHCSHFYVVKDGKYKTYGEGPEYEQTGGFGSGCGISDPEAVLYLNTMLNKLGLDVITTSRTVSWALEAYEKGIIDKKTVGFELKWGDSDSIIRLVDMIAHREGFGDILAEGAYEAAKKLGGEEFVIHTKGLLHCASDPRGKKAYGLGYAVASRGGDHLRALPTAEYAFPPERAKEMFGTEKASDRFAVEGKAKLVIWSEHVAALADSLGICEFMTNLIYGFSVEHMARLLTFATGVRFTEKDLMVIGERIINLERMYLVKHGVTRKDDTLPKRFTHEPNPSKGALNQVVELEVMLDEYYRLRGWSENGIPHKEKLKELGLVS